MLEVTKPLSSARAKNAEHGDMQTFLERLLLEVVSLNYRYFVQQCLLYDGDATMCYPPLLAGERQVSGLFTQALSQVCPVSMPESRITRRKAPIGRGKEPTESAGRVDYFANYGRRSVGLEIKRVPVSTLGPRSDWMVLKRQWAAVDKQAGQALAFMRSNRTTYRYAVGVGILVVRIGRSIRRSNGEQDVAWSRARDQVSRDFSALCGGLQREMNPDFMAAYRPPVEMQTVEHHSESTVGMYPGLLFAASVHLRTSN